MKKLLIIIILLFVGSIQAQLITWTAIKSTIHDSTALKLTASKNLSDLVNTTTARASLGVYSTGSVDTFLGAKLDTTLATALLRSQWNLAYTRSGLFAADTTNWNTAYTDRMKWDGGSTGLVAATGRTSLGLGTIAVKDTSYYYRSTNPSNFIALTNISSTVTGIPYNNTTGVISLLANYFIPTDSMATLWSGKQTYYANLSSIGALANSSGWLKNNGSGTFSYSTPSRTDLGFGTMTMVDSTLYNAKIASIYAPLNNASFTGAHTIPTPFTLGATSVTATGAELNVLAGSGFTAGYVPYFNGTKLTNSGLFYDPVTGFSGIGTTGPARALDVSGNIRAFSSSDYGTKYQIRANANGANEKAWQLYPLASVDGAYLKLASLNDIETAELGYFLFTRTGEFKAFGTGNNYFAGNVGIGTTSPNGILSVTPTQYNTGTASQSLTTVTGVGTTWTSAMVGSQLVYANSVSAGTITAFGSATSLTVSTSQTVASQAYNIAYTGLQVGSTGNVGIGTTTPGAKLQVYSGNQIITSTNGTNDMLLLQNILNTDQALHIGMSGNGGGGTASGRIMGQYGLEIGSVVNAAAYYLSFSTAASERMRIDNSGNVGIGYASDPTSGNILFANGSGYFNGRGTFTSYVTSTQFRLSALNTAPASAIDTGTLGEIRIVNGYIYVCVATNTWQRAAITTW